MKTQQDNYNASCIKILKPEEAQQKFGWLMAQELAQKYSKPLEFIERGIEACRRSSTAIEFFIARYLEKQETPLPRNELLEVAYLEVMAEHREAFQKSGPKRLN
jgi:hypothetical protein